MMKTGLSLTIFLSISVLGAIAPTIAHAQGASLKWYKGNTHTHSSNSRGGDSAPDVVARWYRENGYQFLFITDHDEYLTDVEPLNALIGRTGWFLLLPGQEMGYSITTKDGRKANPHVNGLFTREVIWPQGVSTMEGAIAQVLAQGAIAQVNHPNYAWSLKPEDLDGLPDGTLLEIWNGLEGINNVGGDDGKGDVRPSSEGFWDHLLSRGKIIWAVGADDVHAMQGKDANTGSGKAWIVVRAPELTPAAIRAAITQGDFYASNGVKIADIMSDAHRLAVKIDDKETGFQYLTRFIGQGGKILAEVAGLNPSYRFKGDETYVRATIVDSDGRKAWIQPVFHDGRARH